MSLKLLMIFNRKLIQLAIAFDDVKKKREDETTQSMKFILYTQLVPQVLTEHN